MKWSSKHPMKKKNKPLMNDIAIDEDIDMDDIMQPSPIITGNTTSTPNPSTMEEALLALLTLRTPRRSVEAAPHNVSTNTVQTSITREQLRLYRLDFFH